MAGLTITLDDDAKPAQLQGQQRVVKINVAWDSSYPTGGEAFDALCKTATGLQTIDFVIANPGLHTSGAIVTMYDQVNGKMLAYWVDTTVDGAPLAEVVDTTDLSSINDQKMLVYGR